jgi:heme-degrading monooxygenase HmoA
LELGIENARPALSCEEKPMIARMWRGATTHADATAYARYVADTGMVAYRATPGNRGAHLLQREVGELTEIVTLSFWD